MNCNAIAPSPTAAAQRFVDPERTSPAAKMPGTLVSSRCFCAPATKMTLAAPQAFEACWLPADVDRVGDPGLLQRH
jgi:hypothetical protein